MATSKPLPVTPMQAPEEIQYSTLEVDQDRLLENDSKAAPIVGQDPKYEKIISCTDVDKQAIIEYDNFGKQAVASCNEVDGHVAQSELLRPPEQRKVLGLGRKKFLIILAVIVLLMVAAAVSGGAGGTMATRNRAPSATVSQTTPSPTTRVRYVNTGLAAMQYTGLNGTLHKRIYYQDNSNNVRESAWDNSTAFDAAWQVNTISDAVKPGTPIAAAAGYPHASYKYALVKNMYYMSINDEIFARQAPANDSQAWIQDNLSGLYRGSNSTFLTAYWSQNIQNMSQVLVVLFQEASFANGITQGRYTSNSTTSNPWVANNFGFSHPQGSTFAMAPVSYRSGKHLMLYTVGDGNELQQHEYTISDTDLVSTTVVSLTSESATGLTVQPRSPLAVVAQDNQPLYTTDTLPECARDTPLANLILFAVPDCSSLVLNAWNCSTGFLDHTSEIEPLQKPNTTYLSLAAMSDRATGDGNIYIMFDSGRGPQVEEWAAPKRAGDPWITTRNVNIDVGL